MPRLRAAQPPRFGLVSQRTASPNDLMTLKLRYKAPESDVSELIELTTRDQGTQLSETSDNFRFSAAVAEFAMLLRNSRYKGNTTYAGVEELARSAKGDDLNGYRNEFLRVVELGKTFSKDDEMTAGD